MTRSSPVFPLSYAEILERISAVNPVQYAKSRNFINGKLTYLSPYISRGVISCQQIFHFLLESEFTYNQSEKLIQELAWREYFQRVWQFKRKGIEFDIKHEQTGVKHQQMITAIARANCGIQAIDDAVNKLYTTGYMHNHCRMYIASIVCNIGKAYWKMPANWMYYHLLDGDIASNYCSWQWVSGAFSSKKYYCNQDNINKYTFSNQRATFLDNTYEKLTDMEVPECLNNTVSLSLKTELPKGDSIKIDGTLPVLLYTHYNLDPLWHKDSRANRILILEPSHFEKYAMSEKVIHFIVSLAREIIPGLQLFTGNMKELASACEDGKNTIQFISKEHPLFTHFYGLKEERTWMFPDADGNLNSFSSYWKQCEKYIRKHKPFA